MQAAFADVTAQQRQRRRQRQQQHRLNETTNGHAPGHEQLDTSEYPSSSSSSEVEDNDDQNQRYSQQRLERAHLRSSTPLQLLQARSYEIEKSLFIYLLLFRCIVSIITSRTIFAPDEHWQSLEVAHRIVFGYGFETWEWRDPRSTNSSSNSNGWGSGPIRSPLYPAMFVLPYWLLYKLGLDNTRLLVSKSHLDYRKLISRKFLNAIDSTTQFVASSTGRFDRSIYLQAGTKITQ